MHEVHGTIRPEDRRRAQELWDLLGAPGAIPSSWENPAAQAIADARAAEIVEHVNSLRLALGVQSNSWADLIAMVRAHALSCRVPPRESSVQEYRPESEVKRLVMAAHLVTTTMAARKRLQERSEMAETELAEALQALRREGP